MWRFRPFNTFGFKVKKDSRCGNRSNSFTTYQFFPFKWWKWDSNAMTGQFYDRNWFFTISANLQPWNDSVKQFRGKWWQLEFPLSSWRTLRWIWNRSSLSAWNNQKSKIQRPFLFGIVCIIVFLRTHQPHWSFLRVLFKMPYTVFPYRLSICC